MCNHKPLIDEGQTMQWWKHKKVEKTEKSRKKLSGSKTVTQENDRQWRSEKGWKTNNGSQNTT